LAAVWAAVGPGGAAVGRASTATTGAAGAGGGGGSASPHIAARPATRDVEARLADAARRVVEPVIGIIRYGLEYGVRPGAKIGVDSDAVVALAAALDLLATRRDGE